MNTLTDAVEAYFYARPYVWINQIELSRVAGVGGWRTRVSDATRRGLHLEKRQRTVTTEDGRRLRISERRYVPQMQAAS